jgi:N-methylhydantoinase A
MNIVGIDIGGTFTDLVGVIDGQVVTSKTSTVPSDPTAGVAESLRLANCDPRKLAEVLHGSTIAINTVLERKGAQTALLTTKGFRDVYGIGRSNRIEAFNLFFHRPKPLTRREMTFEVDERLNAAGKVVRPLKEREIETIAYQLRERGVEAVAVCFLHSYANPVHERLVGELLRRINPDMFVTLSHEILREFREYERTSTTVLNAYVGPRVRDYLGTLEAYLLREDFGGKVRMMRSNGGVMSVRKAQEEPVSMMESGPVAGMIGAGRLAAHLGITRAIGFDMGGTTAKASLITDGVPAVEEGYVIGTPASGQPMQLPVVDIVEVGAGGGSIAWVDQTGGLHVGPKSAGADPGPACYGKGAADPAVTDADLVLGRINPNRFLNGGMKLDIVAARKALYENVGRPLGLSIEEAALGIATIADSAMSLAVRAVSVNKGIDPRDTTMIAFGGAGPLHAVNIARQIFIPRVIVPKVPGTFSALGMLTASWRQDFVRTFVGRMGSLDATATESVVAELASEGLAQVKRDGISDQGADFRFFADLRYVGQEHALPISIERVEMLTCDTAALRERFHIEHDKRYGQAAVNEEIEIVNVRLVLTSARADTIAEEWMAQTWEPTDAKVELTREVIYSDAAQPIESCVLWRPAMTPGDTVLGPAVVEEPNSTILIHPGDRVTVTSTGHLVIDLGFEA